MKYNAGDKVRIKSLDWYNENKGNVDKTNSVWCKDGGGWFFYHMSQYCGKIMTIENVWANSYKLEGSDSRWTDEMIEGLVEEDVDLIPKFGEYSDNEPLDVPTMITDFVKEHGLPCPEGYQFVDENGNEILTNKIILEKKKKEYPKTFLGCCDVLGIEDTISRGVKGYKAELFDTLQKLYICRDAYYKIAGDEMGLGKPWEPDWNTSEPKYVIACTSNGIEKQWETTYRKGFAFPTEEMRDTFKENFDSDIEICKEFL